MDDLLQRNRHDHRCKSVMGAAAHRTLVLFASLTPAPFTLYSSPLISYWPPHILLRTTETRVYLARLSFQGEPHPLTLLPRSIRSKTDQPTQPNDWVHLLARTFHLASMERLRDRYLKRLPIARPILIEFAQHAVAAHAVKPYYGGVAISASFDGALSAAKTARRERERDSRISTANITSMFLAVVCGYNVESINNMKYPGCGRVRWKSRKVATTVEKK